MINSYQRCIRLAHKAELALLLDTRLKQRAGFVQLSHGRVFANLHDV